MEAVLQRAISILGMENRPPHEILMPAGNGTQCRVFRTVLEPLLCIKVCGTDSRPLRSEGAILGQLRSPFFPRLVHNGSKEGFLVEEWIRGERLSHLPRGDLLQRLPRIVADFSRLLAVLRTLRPPVIHRDIKPNNLFWRNQGLVVIDMGSAEIEGRRTGWEPGSGQGKLGTGRYPYQPIEQLTGDPRQDRRVDVFAAAAVVFEILTGELPYKNLELSYRDACKEWGRRENELYRILQSYPPGIREALMDALRVDFRERTPTFAPVASAIRRFLVPRKPEGAPLRGSHDFAMVKNGGEMPGTVSRSSDFEDERFRDVRFVVVKITHRCNLACSYCYEDPAPEADMDLSLFRLLTSKVIRNSNRPLVRFVLHGGEPSLMGMDWLTAAVRFVETESRVYRKATRVGMQSNLLALNEEKLQRLKHMRVTLGASLDGPEDIPDPMRPFAGRAIERYKLAKSLGVRIGILMTVNNSNWSHFGRIMSWLHQEMNVSWFRVNTMTPVGRGKTLPCLEPEQIFQAYKEIVDYMIHSGGEIVEENMLGEIRRFVRAAREQEPDSLCNGRDCGAGFSILSVTPEGNILPCGRFSWNDDAYFLGNLKERPKKEHLDKFDAIRTQFHDLSPEIWEHCDECEAERICSFGCKSFIARAEKKANIDCRPTQLRYEYFTKKRPQLEQLLRRVDSRFNQPRGRIRDQEYRRRMSV